MARVRMTAQWLDRLGTEGRAEYVDTEQRGLRLCVRNGRMTWSLRKLTAGGHVRFTIGEYPEVGLAAARKAALQAKAKEDPQAEKRKARAAGREATRRRKLGETVKGALGSWLKDRKTGPTAIWKGGLEGGSARSFLPHVNRMVRDLGDVVITELQASDLERFVAAPEAANTRNHALTTTRTFLTWARTKRLLTRAEADALVVELTRSKTVERTRVLTDDELRALLVGFDSTRYGRAVRLLALTALRREEVLGMEWAWVDLDGAVLTIPPESEKSGPGRGEERRVPLSTAAVRLLEEQRAATFAEGVRSVYVFATTTGARPHPDSLKPALNRLRGLRSNGEASTSDARKRAPVIAEDVTIHDVRRTVANALRNRLKIAPHVVDHVVLGHVRPKLIRTYMPELPIEEARAPLEAWAGALARILGEMASTERGQK